MNETEPVQVTHNLLLLNEKFQIPECTLQNTLRAILYGKNLFLQHMQNSLHQKDLSGRLFFYVLENMPLLPNTCLAVCYIFYKIDFENTHNDTKNRLQ